MELYLRRRTDFYATAPVLLHVAPEACFIKKFRRHLGERYITADLCSPLARVKMDVQAIPFPDNHFDVIFCNHLLEHVADDRLAMRELYRVLKPGGWGVMQVPVDHSLEVTDEDPAVISPEERTTRFGQYDHVRQYGRDYPARLRDTGFTVVEDDLAARLPEEQARLYVVPRDEVICLVSKS
jgi:SAM-dependent methyltransferase